MTPGVPSTKVFNFSFAKYPNLNLGQQFYVPTIGEVLTDAWFEVDTAYATDAIGDFGNYLPPATTTGFFLSTFAGVQLNALNSVIQTNTLSAMGSLNDTSVTGVIEGALETAPGVNPVPLQVTPGLEYISGSFAPIRFLSTDPLLLVVSQDGTLGGLQSGGGAGAGGAGRFYFTTCIPDVLS